GTVIVPGRSGEGTLPCGELARLVSVPVPVERSCEVKARAPTCEGAVAPAPPEAVEPYVTVQLAAPPRVIPETWIVLPTIATDPQVDVVKPAFEPVVEGDVQVAGTAMVSCPLLTPPAAAVDVKTNGFPPEPRPAKGAG